MEIDNYSVREALLLVDGYLSGVSLKVIETVTMQMLTDAGSNEVVKRELNEADLTIVGEQEILQAAEMGTPQRMKETERHEFFYEFLKRVARSHKVLYLIGEKAEQVQLLKTFLEEEYPKVLVAGSASLEECQGDFENIINEMNGETVDVVLSTLPTPLQEEFLEEHKSQMGVKVWYGLGNYAQTRTESSIRKFFNRIFHRHTFFKQMEQYQDHEEK